MTGQWRELRQAVVAGLHCESVLVPEHAVAPLRKGLSQVRRTQLMIEHRRQWEKTPEADSEVPLRALGVHVFDIPGMTEEVLYVDKGTHRAGPDGSDTGAAAQGAGLAARSRGGMTVST